MISSFSSIEEFIGSETKCLLSYISFMDGLGSVEINLCKVVARGTVRAKPDLAMSVRESIVFSYLIGIRVDRRVDL